MWPYAEGKKTVELFSFYFKHLPCIGMFDADNRCVGYQMIKICNQWGMAYLTDEWRGSSLAGNIGCEIYKRLKQQDIVPWWCINHGPTTSMYYRDPDNNQIELQVDIFENQVPWMRVGQKATIEWTMQDAEALLKIATDQVLIAQNHVRRIIVEEYPPKKHEKMRNKYLRQVDDKGLPFSF